MLSNLPLDSAGYAYRHEDILEWGLGDKSSGRTGHCASNEEVYVSIL